MITAFWVYLYPVSAVAISLLCRDFKNIISTFILDPGRKRQTILFMVQLIQSHVFSLFGGHQNLSAQSFILNDPMLLKSHWVNPKETLCQRCIGAVRCLFNLWSDRPVIQGHSTMVHEKTTNYKNHHLKTDPSNQKVKIINTLRPAWFSSALMEFLQQPCTRHPAFCTTKKG